MHSIIAAAGNGGNLQVLALSNWSGKWPVFEWQSNHDGSWNALGVPNNWPPTNTTFFSKLATASINGTLYVIALGKGDGRPYWFTQDSDGVWTYCGFVDPLSQTSFIDVAMTTAPGNVPCIILINEQSTPTLYTLNAGTWGKGTQPPLVSPTGFSRIYAAVGNGGNLQVLAVSQGSNRIQGAWQSNDDDKSWSKITLPNHSPTGDAGEAVFVRGNNDNLQFVYIDGYGQLDLLWQSSTHGSWSFDGWCFGQPPSIKVTSLAGSQTFVVLPIPPGLPGCLIGAIGTDGGGRAEAYQAVQAPNGVWGWSNFPVSPLGDNRPRVDLAVGFCHGQVQALVVDDLGQVFLYYGDNQLTDRWENPLFTVHPFV